MPFESPYSEITHESKRLLSKYCMYYMSWTTSHAFAGESHGVRQSICLGSKCGQMRHRLASFLPPSLVPPSSAAAPREPPWSMKRSGRGHPSATTATSRIPFPKMDRGRRARREEEGGGGGGGEVRGGADGRQGRQMRWRRRRWNELPLSISLPLSCIAP